MENYLIVGGGIAGLLAARVLKANGIPFVGLEKSLTLGGRADVGHHRFYESESVTAMKTFIDDIEWEKVEDTPKQRRKGEWVDLQTDSEEKNIPEELFYLKSPFYMPTTNFSALVKQLGEEVASDFQLRKTVVEINSDDRKIVCQDGSEYPYEKIVWCSTLDALNKLWKGDKSSLLKVMGKSEDLHGGLNLEFEIASPLLPVKNTTVLPFRFKEFRLRALGTQVEKNGQIKLNWLVFLPEEVAEDREEVAKCVRTLHRELEKEFPDLKPMVKAEKIVYLSSISGETPRTVKTLNLLPRLFYLGPEVTTREKDSELRNLDVIVDNSQVLKSTVAN